MSSARINRILPKLREHGIDALIVNRYENRRWVSGVTAHDASPSANAGWLIVSETRTVLVTSFLYFGAAVAEASGVDVVQLESRLATSVADQLKQLNLRRIGFDASCFTFKMHSELREALGDFGELVPVDSDLISPLRATKDQEELEETRRAVEISDRAMTALFGEIKPGMTEREAAWFLESHMRVHGAESMAFEPGVAAGMNASIPHHKPSNYAIQVGDPIWIDIGAKINGYCSDITRTITLGKPTEQYRRIWFQVMEAQKRSLDTVRAGRTGKECDAVARDYLQSVGLGQAFGHSLGHGVGLEIHEMPRLSRLADEKLEPGMIVTVEPGAYLANWGGVRHEELTLITTNGLEVLTKAEKPLSI